MKDAEKLMQTIREQGIKPIPKSYFSMRNALIWVAFASAVLLGALAFSVILFAIQQTDFSVVSHLSHSRLELFLGLLPLIWIVLLIVFLVVAIYSIQYAPKSYKLTAARWVGYSAALSILLGTLFFIAGGAQRLENSFETHLSLYESIQEKKIKLWSNPAAGFLSGTIVSVSNNNIRLKDFNGQEWSITYDSAFIAPVVRLETEERIKIVGKYQSKGNLKALEIRPWGGPEARFKRMK